MLVTVASLASLALGGALPAYATAPLPLGAAPPGLARDSLDHGPQDLAALHGRPVIVHFFATWCAPCREEMAGLARLAARQGEGALAVLAVDVGEVKVRVRRFFEAHPVPFPVLLDEDRAALKAWKVTGLPASFVLDAAHTLRLYADGPVDWDDPATDRLLDSLADPAAAPLGAGLPPLNDDQPPRESSP
ncbi:TlpA disulfide reductase family protein [Ancylobacter vacuolatus]|uniref:Thiol-disulfide isomerase/thioredoxin n=1 Tax=Ancylobacter vacuolatus TaxID=223389 RepID=A0ABU0DDQ6_9HYPH|nr:TlpA disulfide reductase family protein [Ancylobacter vacuolatus]MDQ0346552.1 thiol-disulfide isomerase/thioredoxin [Ancylobacter vacuolatus]